MVDLSPEAQKFREALAEYRLFEEAGDDDYYYEIREKVLLEIFSEHISEMRARIEDLVSQIHKLDSIGLEALGVARARIAELEKDTTVLAEYNARDRKWPARTEQALDVARERIKELEKDLAHWKDCHAVTADRLAVADSTIADLKSLCLTDEKVDASAERLRLGLQVGRLRKALEEIKRYLNQPIGYMPSTTQDAMWRVVDEAISPAEQKVARCPVCIASADSTIGRWAQYCLMPLPCPEHGPEPQKAPRSHVCGLSGYNGMIDPPCPGCQDRHGVHGAEGRE